MFNRKRDLEIVFNLLWNHRPLNADDRSNIVGMYDVPSTTLTWESFKSYLLKNSGSSSADIKVTYIDSDNKEITINSQEQFQLAMYSFRKRARISDIITLKLDKVSGAQKKRDDPHGNWPDIFPMEPPYIAEEPSTNAVSEIPPEWFLKYMKKFKRDIIEDMSVVFARNVSKISSANQLISARKTKSETYKKPRKLSAPTQNSSNGHIEELKKYMKFESKLEKLEQKSMKIKAKKLALKVSKEGCAVPSSKSRLIGVAPSDAELYMNATPVESHIPSIPHMLGGETYLQQWKVINSGEIPWSDETELRFAWGSESLNPVERKVLCPHLLPGEEGTVSVLLTIPVVPGNYECYWHFHHNGVRFGHWLGCLVIVDEPPMKKCLMPTAPETKQDNMSNYQLLTESHKSNKTEFHSMDNIDVHFAEKLSLEPELAEDNIISCQEDSGKDATSDECNVFPRSKNSSESSLSNEEYVFVNKDSNIDNQEGDKADKSEKDIEKPDNEDLMTSGDEVGCSEVNQDVIPEYAYIVYNGEKYPFHKKFLSDEYFERAEKLVPELDVCCSASVPNLSSTQKAETAPKKPRNVSESSSTRLFVFPQHSPGFEVVYPDDMKDVTDSFISFDSNINCNSSSNGQGDSRMSSSRNSLLVNAESQSGCPCNLPHDYVESFRYPHEDFEYYCAPTGCATASCPYKVEEHVYAGCNSRMCNVQMSSTIPNNTTPPRSTSRSSCRAETVPPSNCTTPQMSESVPANEPEHTHSRRPPMWNSRPDNLITGAAILASSAMSTARSMMNMVIQNGGGKWVNGHWVVDNPNTKRENGLRLLAEMGFLNRDLNATLMARYNDDVHRVISELIL